MKISYKSNYKIFNDIYKFYMKNNSNILIIK